MRFAVLGLVLSVLLLVLVAGVGGFFDRQTQQHLAMRTPDGAEPAALPVSLDLLEQLAARIDRVSLHLDAQDSVSGGQPGANSVAPIALAPHDRSSSESGSAPPAPVLPERRLSLIVLGAQPRAIIDGAMVTEATLLDRGGRVERIERDRVVVRERDGHQSLTLSEDRVRRGTLESAGEDQG